MDALLSRRRDLLLAVGALLVFLLLLGRVLGHSGARPPAAAPIPAPVAAPATAAASAVVVDVVGAVRRPGLYRLRDGQRVADAVARAGGATRRANLELINLAAPLADGQQVVVPRTGAPGGSALGSTAAPAPGPVSLSSATLEQLDALPGVGPVTAQKILDYRQAHGAFRSVEELDAIAGIGSARIEQLRDLVVP